MTDQGTEVAEPGTDIVPSDDSGGALAVPPAHVVDQAHPDHGYHPTPRQYVIIAIVLVVLTAIEISLSYIDTDHTNLLIVALFVMGAVKFFLVVGWYMHMKFDLPFFRRIFTVGLVGAAIVYGILFFMFSSTVLKG